MTTNRSTLVKSERVGEGVYKLDVKMTPSRYVSKAAIGQSRLCFDTTCSEGEVEEESQGMSRGFED